MTIHLHTYKKRNKCTNKSTKNHSILYQKNNSNNNAPHKFQPKSITFIQENPIYMVNGSPTYTKSKKTTTHIQKYIDNITTPSYELKTYCPHKTDTTKMITIIFDKSSPISLVQ